MLNLSGFETLIKAISDVLTAGVAIISFSLFIYAVTFKQRDRVTTSFTLILLCMMVIFGTDAFMTVTDDAEGLRSILKIHWLGIIFLPTVYFHFSDALLSMTGKPSRGRRSLVGYLCVLVSIVFSSLLLTDLLVGNVIMDQPPAPFLERTIFNDLYSVFYLIVMTLSWYNYIRAYKRTITETSRRRMLYLIIGAIGPALGSFPYLLYGLKFASRSPLIFWLLSLISNADVFLALILMTYAVSFIGFPWTDRVIRSRLFRWVMRGPITASLTLGATTLINRLGKQSGIDVSAILILTMVAVIVLFEYSITLFARIWERIIFFGIEREEVEKIRLLEDRLLTNNDICQFHELILATLCDLLQAPGACLLVRNGNGGNLEIKTGTLRKNYFSEKEKIFEHVQKTDFEDDLLFIKMKSGYHLLPLYFKSQEEEKILLGIITIEGLDLSRLDQNRISSTQKLAYRAAMALHDKKIQENLFVSLEMLTPQVSVIQDMLASSRFDKQRIYDEHPVIESSDLEKMVKDALDHMWGGPKLSQNPLLQLNIVRQKVEDTKETPVNAIRDILRSAINKIRPDGERQYTNEWILYNLLELKYLAGWKVKDIARKLALSEADLYRKQRVAISTVSRQIVEMEKNTVAKTNV